jgi:hypothetical protein
MATAPATPISTKRREMQDVKAPTMFQFSEKDPHMSGALLGVSPVTVNEKEAVQYMVRGEGGKIYTFLGTYEIDQKIQLWTADHPGESPVGHWLEIRYEGEDPSVKTQGNRLRRFRVQVSKDKEPGF